MHEPSIGPLWLSTSKIALKAEHLQTAYSAILQANQLLADFTFVQSAKLYKANGQVYRALLEMEQGLNSLGVFDATKKLDFDPQVTKQVAKVSNARSRTAAGAASKAFTPRLLCAALAGCKRQADLICKTSMLATSAPSVSIARACLDRCLPDCTLKADAARVLYESDGRQRTIALANMQTICSQAASISRRILCQTRLHGSGSQCSRLSGCDCHRTDRSASLLTGPPFSPTWT